MKYAIAIVLALLLPAGAAVAGPRVLVVSKGSRMLQAFDGSTFSKQFEVKVDGEPHEVIASADGKTAFLADYEGHKNVVWVVDLDTGQITATIDLKPYYKPHGLAVTRDGTRLFVTCEGNKTVAEVDLVAAKLSRPIAVNDFLTHLLVLSPDETALYVTSMDAGNVSVIDVAAGEMHRAILSGKGSEGIDITPDGRELWVVNRLSQTLGILDTVAHKRVTTLPCEGNPMRVKIWPDGRTAVVTCALSGELAFFDVAKRAEIARVATGPFPICVAIDSGASRCFVTDSQAHNVSVVDASRRKVVQKFDVGTDPEGIAYVQ